MESYSHVGKVEAAKRHLTVAIQMFFERKDPIVVYTVAWSAYQILSDICKTRGIKGRFEDNPEFVEIGVSKEVVKAFRAPRNFFHHADKDQEGSIRFFPDMAFLIPLMATELLEQVESCKFSPGRALKIWFYLKFPAAAPAIIKRHIESLPHIPSIDEYDLFLEIIANSSEE